MNIFDPLISGSLSVSGSGHISGDLTVLGTLYATISGTTTNAISASHAASYLLTSSFEQFTGSYTTGSFTGSFGGDGSNLINIPASGVTGLNLSQISEGTATASISQTNGFVVNTNVLITGSANVTGSIVLNGQDIGTGKLNTTEFNSFTSSYITVSGSIDSRLDVLEAYSGSQQVPTASFSFRTSQTDVYCKNSTGYQINKGQVVRIVGAVGDNPLIATASYENDANSANTLGIATENIPNDSFGLVITEGVLLGVNTLGMTAGDLLYLGATGSFTTVSPTAPLHGVRLGEVLRVQQNNGSIYVRIDNGIELNEAHDVAYTSIAAGDLLVRNTNNVWVNSKSLSGSYALTGSLNATGVVYGSNITAIETSTGSLNSFTSSVIGRLNTIEITTSSLNSYTTSANSKFTSIESVTSSFASYSGTTNDRLGAIETSTGSLNTHSSSTNSRLNSIESTTASLTSANSTQDGRLTSLENVTGSYATTGSNIFQGNQTITGSLFISENLVIAGSSSIEYITSSQLNIGDNIITVNAQNPSIRFGGLSVIDSGSSPQLSGSLLFDSVHNQWIFVHQNQGTVTSSVLLMGPETYDNIGNEGYITANRLVKSTGIEHLTNSNISDDGTTVTILSNAVVNGTFSATGTTLVSGSSQINHNSTTNYVANQHIDHSSVSISTGVGSGLTGGGDITTTRNLSIATGGVTNAMLDGSITNDKLTNSSITIAGTSTSLGGSISAATILSGTGVFSGSAQLPSGTVSGSSQINHNTTTNYDANQHIDHTTVSISAGSGLTGGGTIAATRTLSIATGGVTNAMLAGSIENGKLSNSSITIAGTSTSLGGSISAATILSGTNVVSGSAQLSSALLPLSGGTMNGQLIIGSTGTANSPTLRINNSSASSFNHTIEAISTNMTAGQTSIIVLGQAGSTKNAGYLGYNWSSSASNSNYVSLGHWGSDNLLRVYGDGTVYMGTVTTGVWNGSSISTTYTDAKITSVAGTTNQVNVSASTGAVTFSLPQNIHTSATPTFSSLSLTGNLTVSSGNTTGGGIILADDGDIVDLNDAFCSMRFSSGVRIYSANRGGTPVITLGSNGVVTATTFSGALSGNATTATTAGALTSMNISQFTNNSGYITSYTETDTLATVTGRGASTSTAISINNTLTVTSGRVIVRTGGANTYGIVSGYDNNNHLMTFRANIAGSTSSPTITAGHQMCFVEYAEANDTTGWFFKSASTGTYEEIVRITRTGITPGTNGTMNLGSSSARWNTVFTSDLSMSNGIGDYTIVEGEEDLFIYNNKTNKVFKFLLQEVDPSIAPAKKVH